MYAPNKKCTCECLPFFCVSIFRLSHTRARDGQKYAQFVSVSYVLTLVKTDQKYSKLCFRPLQKKYIQRKLIFPFNKIKIIDTGKSQNDEKKVFNTSYEKETIFRVRIRVE